MQCASHGGHLEGEQGERFNAIEFRAPLRAELLLSCQGHSRCGHRRGEGPPRWLSNRAREAALRKRGRKSLPGLRLSSGLSLPQSILGSGSALSPGSRGKAGCSQGACRVEPHRSPTRVLAARAPRAGEGSGAREPCLSQSDSQLAFLPLASYRELCTLGQVWPLFAG